MSVSTCRMGLYLYSRPINQFFKRSIILRSKRFDHWILDSSLWNQFRTISEFFWKKKNSGRDESLLFQYASRVILSLILWSRRIPIPMQLIKVKATPFDSLEQLPLSLCTYPFFAFWTRVFRKIGFGSGLPTFYSRVSLNLEVTT